MVLVGTIPPFLCITMVHKRRHLCSWARCADKVDGGGRLWAMENMGRGEGRENGGSEEERKKRVKRESGTRGGRKRERKKERK